MQPINFEEGLQRLRDRDSRYQREAYLFLRETLEYAQKQLSVQTKTKPRHLTGKELLEGIRTYALEQFGPMAKTVLNEWGVRTCEDVGEIVFNMVEVGLLSKTDTDSREDFKGGFDFDQAFCSPFRPRTPDSLGAPPAAPGGPS